MTTTYTIEPENEPRGEGNGWELCPEDQAQAFVVYSGTWGEFPCAYVASFPSKGEALEYIATRKGE